MKNEIKAMDQLKVQSFFTIKRRYCFLDSHNKPIFVFFRKKVKVEESNYFVCLTTVLKGQF